MSIDTNLVNDFEQAISASTSDNPAVRRLQASLADTEIERLITSYDRMHHRHNRH